MPPRFGSTLDSAWAAAYQDELFRRQSGENTKQFAAQMTAANAQGGGMGGKKGGQTGVPSGIGGPGGGGSVTQAQAQDMDIARFGQIQSAVDKGILDSSSIYAQIPSFYTDQYRQQAQSLADSLAKQEREFDVMGEKQAQMLQESLATAYEADKKARDISTNKGQSTWQNFVPGWAPGQNANEALDAATNARSNLRTAWGNQIAALAKNNPETAARMSFNYDSGTVKYSPMFGGQAQQQPQQMPEFKPYRFGSAGMLNEPPPPSNPQPQPRFQAQPPPQPLVAPTATSSQAARPGMWFGSRPQETAPAAAVAPQRLTPAQGLMNNFNMIQEQAAAQAASPAPASAQIPANLAETLNGVRSSQVQVSPEGTATVQTPIGNAQVVTRKTADGRIEPVGIDIGGEVVPVTTEDLARFRQYKQDLVANGASDQEATNLAVMRILREVTQGATALEDSTARILMGQ